jgi:hypothetical protein
LVKLEKSNDVKVKIKADSHGGWYHHLIELRNRIDELAFEIDQDAAIILRTSRTPLCVVLLIFLLKLQIGMKIENFEAALLITLTPASKSSGN